MNSIAIWLETGFSLDPEQKEIVFFGIKQAIHMITNILIMLALGCLMGCIKETIIFMLLFIPLRSNAGGFHAKSATRCFVISNSLFGMVLFLFKTIMLNGNITFWNSIAVSAIIVSMSPIDNKNKRLSKKTKKRLRKKTLWIVITQILVSIAITKMGMPRVIDIWFYSLVLVLGLQISGVIKNLLV